MDLQSTRLPRVTPFVNMDFVIPEDLGWTLVTDEPPERLLLGALSFIIAL